MAARALISFLDRLPIALALGVLGCALWLGVELRSAAEPLSLAEATVVDASALPVVIGRDELGQRPGPRSAAKRHLRIDRRDGHWVVANAALDRRVFARSESGRGFHLHRWPLREGDRIVFQAGVLEVKIDGETLRLRELDGDRGAVWTDRLAVDGATLAPVCQSAVRRLARRARWALRGFASASDEFELFSIGGSVDCSNRFSVPALEPESLRVTWQNGGFQLAPGASSEVLLVRDGRPGVAFAAREVEVDGRDPVTRLILGRTVYGVTTSEQALTLSPLANRDLWRAEAPALPLLRVDWAGAGLGAAAWARAQAIWLLPGLLLAALAFVVMRLRLTHRRDAVQIAASAAAVGVSCFGVCLALLTQRGEAADAELRAGLLIAAFAHASCAIALRSRGNGIAGLIWASGLSLALVGSITLLLLGAGADNTQWLRFFDKHAFLLTVFAFAIGALAVLPAADLRRAWLRLFGSEWIVAGAGIALVALMAAQLSVGSETGIGGIQPVELTKSVYVVLLGFAGMHLAEVRRRDTREYRRSPLAVLLPFLRLIGGFALVVLSVVVGVRDFSPGIVLGMVTIFWLFRVGRSERRRRTGRSRWGLLRPTAVALLLCVITAASFARLNPERLPASMPQRDRVLVWAQPELHPHSGSQVLEAMDRVGEGGWLGARPWFGPNEEVMTVPAVQDDFITAFFLNRFGGVAGLALLGLQLAYALLLFALARRIEAATERLDFREQNAGRVAGLTLFGLAWMHLVHWGIAWANTLGLLPVMGQPMTWLSAGNSHLLGFALVTLTLALATSWVLRELEPRN